MKNGNDIRDISQGTLFVGETSVVVLSTDAKTVLGNERLASIKLSQVENERAKKFVRQCDRENFAAVRILARCAAAMEIGCHPDNIASNVRIAVGHMVNPICRSFQSCTSVGAIQKLASQSLLVEHPLVSISSRGVQANDQEILRQKRLLLMSMHLFRQ